MRRVRKKRAVPHAVYTAIEQVDLLAGIKAQRRTGGELAIDHDHVARLEVLFDGQRRRLRTEDGRELDQRQMHGVIKAAHARGEYQVRGEQASAATKYRVQSETEQR